MQVEYCGTIYQVFLVDDGTLDTVISINGHEVRYDQEYASSFRDRHGTMKKSGLKKLALEALEEDYYNIFE